MFKNHDRWPTLAVQLISVCSALALAWLLRFDWSFPHPSLFLFALPILVVCRWIALSGYQLTRNYWRYTGIGDIEDLVKSVAAGSALFFVVVRVATYGRHFPESLPMTIYVIEAILTLTILAALRVSAVIILQRKAALRSGSRTEVLVVGAGFAGAILLKALPSTRYKAVAVLDDNRDLHGTRICGAPVIGGIDYLPECARHLKVKDVLVAIPSASGSEIVRISDYCARAGVTCRMVPSLVDLIDGKHQITKLRELNLDDLLGREPVRFAPDGVRMHLQGRVVMVTGAAGSIGSELCKQIIRHNPRQVVCVDRSETALFHLQQRLLAETDVPITCCVTDVGDRARMRELVRSHAVGVIFHAAAYKHVPMVEANAYEALSNNVFALLDLVEIAEECKCEDFLLISTDKAVNPSSLMGCTKRLGEMIVSVRRQHPMRCVTVRFGNVLGSQGSVIPTFRAQIREGRPITVTHPQVTRYFMTIPEAVSLVLQAFTIGEHGDILVLDMGEPIRIADLARTLIHLSGKSEREIPIVFTGMRPGEKLHEALFYDSEQRLPTAVQKVTRALGAHMDSIDLLHGLNELKAAMRSQSDLHIRCKMKELIPEYEWTATPANQNCPAAENARVEVLPSFILASADAPRLALR
jgi:FlaA1/EpsC-like NDP-sugar epimerase